jgi:hypothetical protein
MAARRSRKAEKCIETNRGYPKSLLFLLQLQPIDPRSYSAGAMRTVLTLAELSKGGTTLAYTLVATHLSRSR